MFNFDFQRAGIYRAIWITKNPVFRLARIIKIICLILFVIFCLLFLADFFVLKPATQNFILLGFVLIFLVFSLALILIETFVNSKLKVPQLPPMTPVVNLAEFLSFKVAKSLDSSIEFAKAKRIFPINPTLFLYFLLRQNPDLSSVLYRLLLNPQEVLGKLEEFFAPQRFQDRLSGSIYSEKFEQVIKDALDVAQKKNRVRIEPGDMLLALSKSEPVLGGFLLEADLRPDDIANMVSWWQEGLEVKEKRQRFWDYDNLCRQGSLGRGWAAGYTITLDQYAVDWSEIVVKEGLREAIGYKSEIEQVERVLSSAGINNVLLIGEPGVGTENIIRAITIKSIKGQSLPDVNYKRVMELKIPQMLAQLKGLDEVEDVLDTIFKEVLTAGNVILVINDFHNFVSKDIAPGAIDITGLLASYLHFAEFQLIATTSYVGLHKKIEENPSILNLFSKVEVREPSPEDTLRMLQRLVPALENKYKKNISYQALEQIIELTGRYVANVPFPKKAQEALEETMAQMVLSKDNWVLPGHVDQVIAQKTEIPVGKIETGEKEILLNLEGLIHQRIINQEIAVREVSTALRRSRAKLSSKKRPMGGFLFLGPTGVGKTETSKALAEVYFGAEEKMIRLDMSEFQSQTDVPRLIGSPGEEGLLTTPVRENPFSLILLDEIEKAHSNILNLFLQVLDEGHITDGLGRKVDFSNTIIIATSNAGYKIILEALKNNLDFDTIKEKLLDHLFQESIFRPEFINRFDAVVIFKPLTKQNLLDIAQLLLSKIQKSLIEKNIEFVITQEIKEKVVDLGYDITFGARNLRRVIQDKIENPLAEALLREDIKRGDRIEVVAKTFKVKVLKN